MLLNKFVKILYRLILQLKRIADVNNQVRLATRNIARFTCIEVVAESKNIKQMLSCL